MAQTSRQYIQRMQIIHGAQLTMMIFFASVAFFIKPARIENSEYYLYPLALLSLAIIPVQRTVFKSMSAKATTEATLIGKLTRYFTAYIVRMALIEAAVFLAVVILLITGDTSTYIVIAGLIVLFTMLRPTSTLIIKELFLGADERSTLQDPNGVVQD
jgi:uncharacterized membrane protein